MTFLTFVAENWLLFLAALVSGTLLAMPTLRRGRVSGAVSTGEAVRLINRERGVLIDVGDPAEYAAGHAAGARNVPLAQLEEPKALPTNKTLPLLLMCPSGARAGRAAATLRNAGYEKAFAVSGGTAGWRDAGLPVEKAAAKAAEKTAA